MRGRRRRWLLLALTVLLSAVVHVPAADRTRGGGGDSVFSWPYDGWTRDEDAAHAAKCPIDGSVRELKRAGNRLLFEGRVDESRACFQRALNKWFRPDLSETLVAEVAEAERVLGGTNTISSANKASPSSSSTSTTTRPSANKPSSDDRLRSIFPKSAHIPDEDADSLQTILKLISRRNAEVYSVQQRKVNQQQQQHPRVDPRTSYVEL